MNKDTTYLEIEESNFNRNQQNNVLNLKEEVEKEEYFDKHKKDLKKIDDDNEEEEEEIKTIIKNDECNEFKEGVDDGNAGVVGESSKLEIN